MARRPSELSIRPRLVTYRQPQTPGGEATQEREGIALPTLAPEFPISAEQDEARLARYEEWKAVWNGSLPEFIVWEFLTIDKGQIPQVDFIYQQPIFGGRTEFGGYVLDFYLPMRSEGWRVMGERWHLEQPPDRARDFIAKAQLVGQGINVIDLWEDDLLSRERFVLNLAWDRGASAQSRAQR